MSTTTGRGWAWPKAVGAVALVVLTASARGSGPSAVSLQALVPGSRVDLASGRWIEGSVMPPGPQLGARGEWLGQPFLLTAAPGVYPVQLTPPCRAGRCLPAQLFVAAAARVKLPTDGDGVFSLGAADYPDILRPAPRGAATGEAPPQAPTRDRQAAGASAGGQTPTGGAASDPQGGERPDPSEAPRQVPTRDRQAAGAPAGGQTPTGGAASDPQGALNRIRRPVPTRDRQAAGAPAASEHPRQAPTAVAARDPQGAVNRTRRQAPTRDRQAAGAPAASARPRHGPTGAAATAKRRSARGATARVRVGAAGVAMLWMDVALPLDAAPGVYRGELRVGGQRAAWAVEVLPLELPQRDVARLSAVNFDAMRERLVRDPDGFRRWMQLAKAHLLSIEPIRITPARIDGRPDWAGYAAAVGPYLSGAAFTPAAGYQGPLPGLPLVRWVVPPTDWWPVDDGSRGRPPDPAAWAAALEDWAALAVREGWTRGPAPPVFQVFINSLDEPNKPAKLEALASYAPLMRGLKLPPSVRLYFRVDGPFGTPIPGLGLAAQIRQLDPAVDLWNLHGAPLTMPFEHMQDVLRRGERVTVYASNTAGEPSIPPLVVDAPLIGARVWGWIVWRYGLHGAMNWEVDLQAGCVANPRCSPGGRHNLDATLIYRGEEVGEATDQPIPSMRLKLLRRGSQDAALLHALAQRDPAAAQRIARELVPYALGDHTTFLDPAAWSKAPLSYHQARQAILRILADRPPPAGPLRVDARPSWARPFYQRPAVLIGALAFALTSAFALAGLLRARRRRRPNPPPS